MQAPVIQKVIFSKQAFVERRLDGEGRFFVKKGSQVRPFDFVAEIKDTVHQRLTAGVGGEVVKLLPGKAVLIQTAAVIIRGVVGRGEDSEGEIRIAAGHDEPIGLEVIDAGCAGDILVGGWVPSLEVFKKAEAVGVGGIVCGGADFAAFAKTDLPTLLTEGFGRPPLNHQAFKFLQRVGGRHVFLSPEYEELLVARLDDGDEAEAEVEGIDVFAELEKGMAVQVFTSSNFGQTGKVEKILPPRLASSASSRDELGEVEAGGDLVVIVLESGDRIEVGGRNIGIIK